VKAKRQRALFDLVFARDHGCCAYCGIEVIPRARGLHRSPILATLDHLRPRSKGGATVPDNLVLACQACNGERGILDADAFRALKRGSRRNGGEA
jgi:5-methylcytosine-specific restriction endonuclease McrA